MAADKKTNLNAFLAKDPAALSLYDGDFRDSTARLQTIQKVSHKQLNPEIISVLQQQNKGVSSQSDANLISLATGNCCVAVTGQQIGVLGGPALTYYKILSVIKVAEQLSAESQSAVIPIFWMQTEDHDLAEISFAEFFNHSENVAKFQPSLLSGENAVSVGEIILDSSFASELAHYLESIAPEKSQIKEALLSAYQPGATLAEAFRNLWQSIVGHFGVLFFDPCGATVKKLASSLIQKSFSDFRSIEKLLSDNSENLKQHGFEAQVALKKNSPLWFFSHNNKRSRLSYVDDNFISEDKIFSAAEIESQIQNAPEKFSSSALIRPILQDFIFPTAAYVCGPAEFNYWGQIKPLYNHFKIIQPLVVPRSNFRIIEAKCQSLLSKSGFSIADLELNHSDLLAKKFAGLRPENLFSFIRSWDADLNDLKAKITQIDANLSDPLEKSRDSVLATISKLRARVERSLTDREQNSFAQLERVRQFVCPKGKSQDKVIAAAYFLLKYGLNLSDQLLNNCDPLNQMGSKDLFLSEYNDTNF